MVRGVLNLPRPIKPELIELGDTVTAVFKRDNGVQMTQSGTVEKIETRGATRLLRTREGGVIAAWSPGIGTGLTFTLTARREPPQTPLSGLSGFALTG